MSITDRINSNLQTVYNIEDPKYKALICDKDGTNPDTITKPTDIDLGVITSQIEFLRRLSIDLLKQIYIDQASGEFLKFQLNEFFDSLRLEDETDTEWVQRTIATVLGQKVSRASIIYALRPYSSQEPEITTTLQESAFADFSFADAYTTETFTEITTIIDNYFNWTSITQPETNSWQNTAYGNGVFITVATNGTNRIMRSEDDGLTWSAVSASGVNSWQGIAYGNGVFVAVAYNGTNRIMRSEDDGLTWTSITEPETNGWMNVAYGNGVFIAVSGGPGANSIMRSEDDGLTWSAVPPSDTNTWQGIAYGNGVFITVATNGTNRIMRSEDNGLTWVSVVGYDSVAWQNIAYGDGVFIAIGPNSIMRSEDDGLTWENITSPENNIWINISYNQSNNTFISVSGSGSNRIMISETNGLTWSLATAPENNSWIGLANNSNGLFIATSGDGTNRIMRSYHDSFTTSEIIYVLPALAGSILNSLFTVKVTLYDTSREDIWTVQNILRKILAAGISYILEIIYT